MVSVTSNTNRESDRGHLSFFKPPAIGEGNMNNLVRTFKKAFTEISGLFPARRILQSILFVAILILASGCVPAGNGGFVVNSTRDAGDSNPGDAVCRTAVSATECTLRAAIEEADAWAGVDMITFNIPDGPFIISPGSVLPVITEDAIIDGTTQPGYLPRITMVTLDGSGLGPPMTLDGLTVAMGINVKIKGLSITEFPDNGIVNRGMLTLEKMVISRNHGDGLGSGGGSAVLPVSILDSDFTDNGSAGISADKNDVTIQGGTISGNRGGIGASNGSLAVTGTQILNNVNSALIYFGGIGLYLSNARIDDAIIDGNDSHNYGGGIDFLSDGNQTLIVSDSTISNNIAYHAGGIEVQGGTARLNHATLIDNIARIDGGAVRVHPYGSVPATLTIENGTAIGQPGHGNISDYITGDSQIGRGGGIYSESDVEIADSFVEGNLGDGIYNNGGFLVMENGTVTGNTKNGIASVSSPGAVATLRINESTIQGNTLTGIDTRHTNLFFAGGRILDNSEGGLQMFRGNLVLSGSTISGNTHHTDGRMGGGIGLQSMDDVFIETSTVSGNHASTDGGGLYIQARSGDVQNTTVSGNQTGGVGGGIVAAGDAVTLNNVTVTLNQGVTSGGILGDDRLTIRNTIVAENAPYNCGGPTPFISGGNNLDDGSTCGFTAGGDISGIPALLGPLAGNGSGTFTHALLPGSPALEAGDDATCLPDDQRGVSRPQGLHCDIGAFESETPATATPPSVTVTPTPAFTPTGTPLPPAAKIIFDPVDFSTNLMYTKIGRSCTPKEVTIEDKVSPAELVGSVGLFYRLEEKEGTNVTLWGGGSAMIPQGGGWYKLTLTSEDFPDVSKLNGDLWLAVQFVANGPDGQILVRSAVYRQVTVGQCHG
jgi:CSLREA domain-containing protein